MNERQTRQARWLQPRRDGQDRRVSGQVPHLPGIRRLLAAALPWAVVFILPILWPGDPVKSLAQGATLNAGPSGTFGSVYWFDVVFDPVFSEPCSDDNQAAVAAQFATGPGGRVSVTCAFGPLPPPFEGVPPPDDPLLVRYVVLVEGPRCLVTWQGRAIERRPCAYLPQVRT